MREKNPLTPVVEKMKISGAPLKVKNAKERTDCHNIAIRLGYSLRTWADKTVGGSGFWVQRWK